jgi:hypothetical protein
MKRPTKRLSVTKTTIRHLSTVVLRAIEGGRDASLIITRCETQASTCTDPGPK